MTIDLVQSCCLTETQKLIVNKTMSDCIQLINILKNVLAFVVDQVLHEIISTKGYPQSYKTLISEDIKGETVAKGVECWV